MGNYNVFVKPTEYQLTQRKIEGYRKFSEIKNYYQRNPVKFIEEVLGAKLFDAQAYCVEMSWTRPYTLWTCTRGFGKSSVIDLILMAKSMLYNNYLSYIAAGSSEQSIQTFQTLIRLANKSIESMTGLTDVFKDQVEVKNATGDGFVRNPAGNYCTLYNGSTIKTLNSSIDRRRGARANMVVFDETGWLSEEMLNVYAAFTIVNKDLKLGGDVDVNSIKTLPREVPNQLMYISSASATNTPFYTKYRDFSKQMLLGDPDYFVAEVNCDVVIEATVGGKVYPTSLLTRATVDGEMRANQEKALREYYCRFSDGNGINNVVKRAWIARNSYIRPPILYNDTNERRICIFIDPARSNDDSIALITELKYDEATGYSMDVINCISFVDIQLKNKTPMMYQDQINEMRKIILQYNGDVLDYENIEVVMCDAGAGGGGNSWLGDSLMEDWVDKSGKKHKGIIDGEYSSEYVGRYPNAARIMRLENPTAVKADAFEALARMIEANLITFPSDYDNKGYLNLLEIDEKALSKKKAEISASLQKENLPQQEFEERLEEELSKIDVGKVKVYKLSPEEEVALKSIDGMKEQIVNICRYKRDMGKDIFKLPDHKDAATGVSNATMHDDKAYCLALAGYYLQEKRLEKVRMNKPKNDLEILDSLIVKSGSRRSGIL